MDFTYHFQRIVGFNDTHIEALFRNKQTNLFDPLLLSKISIAEQFKSVVDILVNTELKGSILHFNVNSSTTENKDFSELLKICSLYKLNPKNIVLEFVENALASTEQAQLAKKLGFKVALDDLGMGYSIASLDPFMNYDILKLDKLWLSSDFHIKGLATLINCLKVSFPNSDLVLEGIESEYHRSVAQAYGIEFLQGFYFDTPRHYHYLTGLRKVVA